MNQSSWTLDHSSSLAKIFWLYPFSNFKETAAFTIVFYQYCYSFHWFCSEDSLVYHVAFDTNLHHFLLSIATIFALQLVSFPPSVLILEHAPLNVSTDKIPISFYPHSPSQGFWWTKAFYYYDLRSSFYWESLIPWGSELLLGSVRCCRNSTG